LSSLEKSQGNRLATYTVLGREEKAKYDENNAEKKIHKIYLIIERPRNSLEWAPRPVGKGRRAKGRSRNCAWVQRVFHTSSSEFPKRYSTPPVTYPASEEGKEEGKGAPKTSHSGQGE